MVVSILEKKNFILLKLKTENDKFQLELNKLNS